MTAPVRSAPSVQAASALLLACLQIAAEAQPAVPTNFIFLPGSQADPDLSAYEDMCCAGTAYVRVAQAAPASMSITQTDSGESPCQPLAWNAVLEMGIMRCAPSGTITSIPTPAQWTAAHQLMMQDFNTMVTAFAQFKSIYDLDQMFLGDWQPVGPNGGCLIGTIPVTTQVMGC